MSDEVLRRRGRPSKLDAFRHDIGRRSDEEIAKEAGCSVANVYMYRRRHNIAAAEEAPPAPAPTGGDRRRGSVLDRYQHLLGKLSDAEVARLANCTAANVSIYRRKHNISSRPAEAEAVAPVVEAAPVAAEPVKAKRGRKKKEVVVEKASAEKPAPVVATPKQEESAPVVAAPVARVESYAYVVRIDGPSGSEERVVIGTSLPDALTKAAVAEQGGARISAVRLVGALL